MLALNRFGSTDGPCAVRMLKAQALPASTEAGFRNVITRMMLDRGLLVVSTPCQFTCINLVVRQSDPAVRAG